MPRIVDIPRFSDAERPERPGVTDAGVRVTSGPATRGRWFDATA